MAFVAWEAVQISPSVANLYAQRELSNFFFSTFKSHAHPSLVYNIGDSAKSECAVIKKRLS